MSRKRNRSARQQAGSSALACLGLGTLALNLPAHAQFRFAPPHRSTLPGVEGAAIALGDLNGDAKMDAAVAGYFYPNGPSRLYAYFHLDHGLVERRFIIERPTATFTLAAGDLDGDGHVDLAWSEPDGIGIWYNSGDGVHGQFILEAASHHGRRFRLADMDGDGVLDIAVVLGPPSGPAPQIEARLSRGRGQFEPRLIYEHSQPGYGARDLALGDIDGDGDIDAAVVFTHQDSGSTYDSELVYLANDGMGDFSQRARWPLPWRNGVDTYPQAITMGDLDGDGDLDFFIATGEHYHSVELFAFRNDGDRITQTAILGSAYGYRVRVLTTSDLDLDGNLDVLFAGQSDLYVFRNRGNGSFNTRQTIELGRGKAVSVATADLYWSGQWDIAALVGTRFLSIVRNTTFEQGPRLFVGPLTQGEPVSLAVRHAQPGETVHFLHSLGGAGHAHGQPLLGGMVLDLLEPITLFGSAVADADGTAVLRRIVPPNAPLRNVVFQAIIRRGPGGEDSVKTPFRTARIEPN